MKTTLTLNPLNGGPFNCLPSREVSIDDSLVLCNNVTLPFEFNPHNVRLWVIGNEFGPVCAVWADCEQDALDEMIDSGMGDSFLVSSEDQESATDSERDGWAFLGNAGEPCDLTNAWIQTARLMPDKDCQILCKFAEARGAGQTTLES